MDSYDELLKYKDLLDQNAITEEEFRKIKQKLLGLKTDEEKSVEEQELSSIEQTKKRIADQEEALRKEREKFENELAEADKLVQENDALRESILKLKREKEQWEQKQLESFDKKSFEPIEKQDVLIKDFQEIERDKEEQPIPYPTKEVSSKVTIVSMLGKLLINITCWIFAAFCIFMGVPCLAGACIPAFMSKMCGILFLLVAILVCPIITRLTSGNPFLMKYYRYKKLIVAVLTVTAFYLLVNISAV